MEVVMLFNEGPAEVVRKPHFPPGKVTRLDPASGLRAAWDSGRMLALPAHGWAVFGVGEAWV
jgi:hypothetical protein